MRQPYENVYLGNFIFALGYFAASDRDDLSNKAIQLVQQTPDEKELSDLFINWGGRSFIFEFKRNESKIKSELSKEPKKKLNLAIRNDENIAYKLLSYQGHWLAYGIDSGLRFIRYASLHENKPDGVNLSRFCKALLARPRVSGLGLEYGELKTYLSFIGKVTDTDSEGCGGFILNISEDGNLNMIPFESVKVLSNTIDKKPDPPQTRNVPIHRPR